MSKYTLSKLKPRDEYLLSRNTGKANEDLKIEVGWQQDCIKMVMADLEKETGGAPTIESVLDYVLKKNEILGRETIGKPETAILPHIKDLVFQHSYGKTVADTPDATVPEADKEKPLKSVVINEIARRVIDLLTSSEKSITIISKDPLTPADNNDYPGEICVDLPWEYDSESTVIKYDRFCELIENKDFVQKFRCLRRKAK